ncbi:hypothetical protein BGZ61DRAFT_517835 [Ilyonectria robusta]|uniref:uncharacterized protein n=1 Tax=Ilyonectria robusta TaxID=1079257 RepID=UPI001E8E7A59|nr:uncharacterized protein BGZ61DRAFT_517835 [Ilyonectria robusta]KAH8699961.1 hypothetical protein BGZ61DRAFT_517835 [Ilyonectria robusta]
MSREPPGRVPRMACEPAKSQEPRAKSARLLKCSRAKGVNSCGMLRLESSYRPPPDKCASPSSMRTWNGIASHLLSLAQDKHRTVTGQPRRGASGMRPGKPQLEMTTIHSLIASAGQPSRTGQTCRILYRRAEGRAAARTQSSLLGLFWKPTGDGWDGIPLTSYWTAKLTGRVHGERNICPSSQPQEESSGASSTAPGDG